MTGQARGRWTAGVLAGVLLAVEAVIVAESWRGLVGFAALIGIHGVAAWGVPVTLDGVSLVAALVALRAELAGEASGLYRAVLFVFTAASAAANYWHARTTGSEEAAIYLGGMSVAVAVVFALALRQIRREDRRKAGTVTGRLPRFSVAHWARYPGLTWRAWSLAIRDGHTSPREALDAALALRGQKAARPGGQRAAIGRPVATATTRSRRRPKKVDTKRPSAADTEAAVLSALATNPAMTNAELAAAVGTSERTARRYRRPLETVATATST